MRRLALRLQGAMVVLMPEGPKKLSDILFWLYLLLLLAVIVVAILRMPLSISPPVAIGLLVTMVVIWLPAFVVLPLIDWVRLENKAQVPLPRRFYKVVVAVLEGIVPIFLLRHYLHLPQTVEWVLAAVTDSTLVIWLIMNLFPKYFKYSDSGAAQI